MDGVFVPTGAGRAALDELDRVEWTALAHAYTGSERDFSGQLIPCDDLELVLGGLHNGDPEVRAAAYEAVMSSVWHQGTIYPATAAVVPFLAAFAADLATPARGRILAALVAIAEACTDAGVDDPASQATRRAFVAARRWLERAAELGPELARGALASIDVALSPAAARHRTGDVVAELEEWAEAEEAEAEPPLSDEEVATELEGHARWIRGAPYEAQSFGVGRAHALLTRAPALALTVAEAADHPDVMVRARLVALQALARLGDPDALAEVRGFVREWLGPAVPGAVNQRVTRDELLAALDHFPRDAVTELRRAVDAAGDPELALPDGDVI